MPEVKPMISLLNITQNPGPLVEEVAQISYQTQRFYERTHPKLIKFKSGRTIGYDEVVHLGDPEPTIGKPLPGYVKDDQLVAEVIPASWERMIKFLLAIGHHIPFEYCYATFMFKNITRKAALHLLRYRFTTVNMQSQKYQPQNGFNYLLPGLWDEAPPGTKRALENYMSICQQAYEDLRKTGIDPEWSRCCYPNNIAQTMTFGTNFRQWRHLFDCLCDDDYVGEDQFIMVECLKTLKCLEPTFFHDFTISDDGKSARRKGTKYSRNKKVNWTLNAEQKQQFGIEVPQVPGNETDIP